VRFSAAVPAPSDSIGQSGAIGLLRVTGYPKNMYNVCMPVTTVWDEPKNRTNRRKHGISFEEAQTVFADENALRYFDPDHSTTEDRFLLLGLSWNLRVLVVRHWYRQNDSIVRIISARKANKLETRA